MIFLVLLFVFPCVVFAETTSVLLPIADGGNDSDYWTNETGGLCSNVDCYTEIDEGTGVFCSDSDGDTTYIEIVEGSDGSRQTFDVIDESTIPDNSTITQASITVCHKKSLLTGGSFQTTYCHSGSCVDSNSTVNVNNLYNEITQVIPLSYVKIPSTNIEVGVRSISTSNAFRISKIKTVLTYTLATSDTVAPSDVGDLSISSCTKSSCDLTWTSPGDDGTSGTATHYDIRYSTETINDLNWDLATQVSGEPTPSVYGTEQSMTINGLSPSTTYFFAIKSQDEASNESNLSNIADEITLDVYSGVSLPTGGVQPTKIIFSGQAFPDSEIKVSMKNDLNPLYINNPETIYEMSDDGKFFIDYTGLLTGEYFITLKAVDKDKIETGSLAFNINFRNKPSLIVKDILFPPTLNLSNKIIKIGSNFNIFGYSSKDSIVKLIIDNLNIGEVVVDSFGYYHFDLGTDDFEEGVHYVKVKQIKNDQESSFSYPQTFKITSFELSQSDLNEDGITDIIDWSIFLYRWVNLNNPLRSKIDFDNNGIINIIDFSIFLKSF